ncbi:MAG: lytic transglycosylase domain-containing protein [Bryobacteraceae bacterium]|nr:lytic transglycosylase domain-containing protein [Bryobacteraceae bacterium]MDW8378637.1 lytic transglycosylase domain-containing protein [Bryobacterales bacterium]
MKSSPQLLTGLPAAGTAPAKQSMQPKGADHAERVASARGSAQSGLPPFLQRQQGSIQKQQASVERQLKATIRQVGGNRISWFSTPWPGAAALSFPAAVAAPPARFSNVAERGGSRCDPLPPERLAPIIRLAAQREGVPETLVRAVIERESSFRPCAVSAKGALGLMQLMPDTAQELGIVDPFDPQQSIDGGVKLLKRLLDRYEGNVELALSAYHAGAGRVDRAGGVPDIPETKEYVIQILSKLLF